MRGLGHMLAVGRGPVRGESLVDVVSYGRVKGSERSHFVRAAGMAMGSTTCFSYLWKLWTRKCVGEWGSRVLSWYKWEWPFLVVGAPFCMFCGSRPLCDIRMAVQRADAATTAPVITGNYISYSTNQQFRTTNPRILKCWFKVGITWLSTVETDWSSWLYFVFLDQSVIISN